MDMVVILHVQVGLVVLVAVLLQVLVRVVVLVLVVVHVQHMVAALAPAMPGLGLVPLLLQLV
jgi:hypothetical protein